MRKSHATTTEEAPGDVKLFLRPLRAAGTRSSDEKPLALFLSCLAEFYDLLIARKGSNQASTSLFPIRPALCLPPERSSLFVPNGQRTMLPTSFSFFALILISPLLLASPSSASPNQSTIFHPIGKHHGSTLHPPSPFLSGSSTIFSASSPLSFQLKTTRRTILRRRAGTGSSGLILQGPRGRGGAWSNLGWDSASNEDDDELRWEEVEVDAPDLTDKQTVLNLARMANDAYATPGESRWMELDKFNLVSSLLSFPPSLPPSLFLSFTTDAPFSLLSQTLPFGWGEDDAGLRGHVFADSTNSTLVVSIKGTSLDGPVPKGGSTARLDRINDNKLFSCCW